MWVYMNGTRLRQAAPNKTDLTCLGGPTEGFKLFNAPYGTHKIQFYATPISELFAPESPPTDWSGLSAELSIVSAESDPRPTWMKYQVATAPWPNFGGSITVKGDTWQVDPWGYQHTWTYLDEEVEFMAGPGDVYDDGGSGSYAVYYLSQSWNMPRTVPIVEALAEASTLVRVFAADFARRFLDEERRLAATAGECKSRFELLDDD